MGVFFLLFTSSPFIVLTHVLLKSTMLILPVSTPAVFQISFIVSFSHVLHKSTKLPVLNAHFNFPFHVRCHDLCDIHSNVPYFSYDSELASWGVAWGCLCSSWRRISFGDFNSGVKFSRFGEYALVDREHPNRSRTLLLPDRCLCSVPFLLSDLLVSSLFLRSVLSILTKSLACSRRLVIV